MFEEIDQNLEEIGLKLNETHNKLIQLLSGQSTEGTKIGPKIDSTSTVNPRCCFNLSFEKNQVKRRRF
jgi:hypothetical protein